VFLADPNTKTHLIIAEMGSLQSMAWVWRYRVKTFIKYHHKKCRAVGQGGIGLFPGKRHGRVKL